MVLLTRALGLSSLETNKSDDDEQKKNTEHETDDCDF